VPTSQRWAGLAPSSAPALSLEWLGVLHDLAPEHSGIVGVAGSGVLWLHSLAPEHSGINGVAKSCIVLLPGPKAFWDCWNGWELHSSTA
jgi:hypothetical protein